MTTFRLRTGERGYLPPFMPGTTDLVAMYRPDTPLACVAAGIQVTLKNRNLLGLVCAVMTLRATDFHVVTQPGNQYVVSPLDILAADDPISPQCQEAFRLGQVVEVTASRPIASAAAGFWNAHHSQVVTVRELWRRRNALVLGRISDEVEPDSWLETDIGNFLAEPGAYVLQEFSGRGVRIVPPFYMGREFASVRNTDGHPVEEFLQTKST